MAEQTALIPKPQEVILLEQERDKILPQIHVAKIENQEQFQQAGTWLAVLRKLLKAGEAARLDVYRFYANQQKQANDQFIQALNPVAALQTALDREYLVYNNKLIEQQRKAQEKAEVKAEKKFEAAKANGHAPQIPEVIAPIIPQVAKTQQTEAGNVTTREVKKFSWEYEDETQKVRSTSKIPEEYWIVDEAKIKKVVAAGVDNIPGIKIKRWIERETSVR